MKIVRLFDIRWDTDADDPSELGLPSEHLAIVEDDWNPEEEAADLLADQFGFCVFGCSFKLMATLNERKRVRAGRWRHHRIPGPDGTIRRRDIHGNVEEVRELG